MNQEQSLILLEGWSITIPKSAEQARAHLEHLLDAVDYDGEIPQNSLGQSVADEMAVAMSQVKGWMASLEAISAELRKPYFDHAKRIKAKSDEFMMPLAAKLAKIGGKLAEFEADKKRIEIELERQRQEEAARLRRQEEERQRQAEIERRRQEQEERDRLAAIERKALAAKNEKLRLECEAAVRAERERQAQAEAERERQRQAEQQQLVAIDSSGVAFEAPKTAGVTVNVGYEFEITDTRALAEYCWRTGKAWVNEVTFFKRDIMAWINSDSGDRNIPGMRVYRAVGATVRKAKGPRTINVQSSKVEL